VAGDPGNPLYTKSFIDNLCRKYNNNKKGSNFSGIKTAGAKASMKKASHAKDWSGTIAAGLEILKLNPWDTSALVVMANACEESGWHDCQLNYLRTALDANPKDIEINRVCGRALRRLGKFDDAIACWRRVQAFKPTDEEAMRAIADLAVDKTIQGGRYEEAESSQDVRVRVKDEGEQLSPEKQLEKSISKNPHEIHLYVELADLHARNDRYAEAEDVLARALAASKGDLAIRERLEDTQVRRLRQEIAVAERALQAEPSDEAKVLLKQKIQELNELEIDIYRGRSERSPQNYRLKYEYGLRLKRSGKFADAIQALQAARADNKLKGDANLELGECFESIKQYKLAISNYSAALEYITEREIDKWKLTLYRVGKLSYLMKDIDGAEKYLTQLASLDFGFKDVAKWLEKIAQDRNNGEL
jgi:tetratricopeptide (TPR) repeat protein